MATAPAIAFSLRENFFAAFDVSGSSFDSRHKLQIIPQRGTIYIILVRRRLMFLPNDFSSMVSSRRLLRVVLPDSRELK